MKLLFWLVKNKRNKQGLVPIYCRITINGERAEVATNIWILEKDFDKRYKKVRNSHPDSESYNKALLKINSSLNNIFHNQVFFEDITPTSKTLKNMYEKGFLTKKKYIKPLLNEYIEAKHKINPESEAHKKDKRYCLLILRVITELNYINEKIEDFTERIFENLTVHIIEVLEYSIGYCTKAISFLKAALLYAYNQKYTNRYPVAYKVTYKEKNNFIYLTENELNKLRNHTFVYPSLNRAKDCFLMQCLTGLAYIDLKKLNKNNFVVEKDGLWIDTTRQKVTTAECTIPVTKEALKILKRYDFKLPVVSNQKYNSHLKRIAQLLNINKKLTSHVGRKTFGTILLNKDVPIETVSTLLGHSNVKITQKHYAKVLHMKIARDIRLVL